MKCLVVDDSDVVRKIARHYLADYGADTREAANGVDALAACDAAMPDLIIADRLMPAMGGREFIVQLRQRPDGDRPYIIYSTSENDPRDIAHALTSGANDYLIMPFDHESFHAKIRQALEPA
jgi:two-component system chemotaxis response regulator CheY